MAYRGETPLSWLLVAACLVLSGLLVPAGSQENTPITESATSSSTATEIVNVGDGDGGASTTKSSVLPEDTATIKPESNPTSSQKSITSSDPLITSSPSPSTTSPSTPSSPQASPSDNPGQASTSASSESPPPSGSSQVDSNLQISSTNPPDNKSQSTTPLGSPNVTSTPAASSQTQSVANSVTMETTTLDTVTMETTTSQQPSMELPGVTNNGTTITGGYNNATSGSLPTDEISNVTTASVGDNRNASTTKEDFTTTTPMPTGDSIVTTTTEVTSSEANVTVEAVATTLLTSAESTSAPHSTSTQSEIGITTESQNTTTESATTRGVTTESPGPCDSSPCQNNAICSPGGDGEYSCACAPGWMGQQCSEDIDECASSPCANSSPCENGVNSFVCNCLPGYTGVLCDEDIDDCSDAPCLNGGLCTDQVSNFSCTCLPGFTGDTCEIDIDDCENSPCLNNGVCMDGPNSYSCECDQFWTGDNCEQDVNECDLDPIPDCNSLSSCSNTEGGYVCTCPEGYTGTGAICDFINMCEDSPCSHGACIQLMLNYTCLCDEGWTGLNCTEDINECEIANGGCDLNNGECINTPGKFRCQCLPGSHGNGFLCFKDTVYTLGTNSRRYNADIDQSAIFQIPGGFPYFGSRYYKVYASIDGYVTFTQDYLPPNPPGAVTPMFPPGSAIIAPWWTDLDTTHGPGALWVDSYEPDDGNVVFSKISADIGNYVGSVNLTHVLVFTWREVEPYPSYDASKGKENATFQLVLATTNEESFGMFNYKPDGPWLNMDATERRFLIGYSFGNGSDVKIELEEDTPGYQSNIGHDGRYFFRLGDKMAAPDLPCLVWYRSQKSLGPRAVSLPCPCTWKQADLDSRFSKDYITLCAQGTSPDDSSARQKCCYDSMGALQTSYPYGGYPILEEDADARVTCCEKSELCHLFYELRTSDNCKSYTTQHWALTWGIGHYETINSERFTFNDRGQFTLFSQGSFTLQGWTNLVDSLVPDMMTTALVAVACKASNSSVAEVGIGPNRDLIAKVDGLPATMGDYPGLRLSKPDADSILIQFVSGEGVLVTAIEDVLRVRLMIPEELPIRKGLFTATPGGTQQQLSQYAAIPEGGSLFAAKNISYPDYMPSDLSATIGDLRKQIAMNQSEAAESCDGEMECFYDFIATGGEIQRGISAITERVKMLERRRKLDNFPPTFTNRLPGVQKVSPSRAVIMNLEATDPEGGLVIYNISTNLNSEDYTFLESGYFRWQPKKYNHSIYIQFSATDLGGATTIYWPEVRFCDCVSGNTLNCDFDYINILGSRSDSARYWEARCPCVPGYTGSRCADQVDLCSPNPCYTATEDSCGNVPGKLPYGVSCSQCPENLSGDGLRCYDVNECLRQTHKCSHQCVNQPGSYSCACPDGFTLRDDRLTCQDVDECTRNEYDCPGVGQYCQNTPGSYMCACKAKYFMHNKTCIEAPRRYGGVLVYQALQLPSGEILTWSPDLEDKESARYKQEASLVEEEVTNIYKTMEGFKGCEVTEFRSGSTMAYFDINVAESSPTDGTTVDNELTSYVEEAGCTDSGPACTMGPLVGISLARSFAKAKNRCLDDADNDCDSTSTNCSSHLDGTFSCSCLPGFQAFLDFSNICQDKDECEGFNECDPAISECVNTIGSYECKCKPSYRKVDDKCVPACVPNPCKNGGECYPNPQMAEKYSCGCNDYWAGAHCQLVNRQAKKLEQILIGVGAGLGAIVLIFLIIIIIMCFRMRNVKRTYSTTTEVGFDSWENNTHAPPPSAHHLRTTQLEMTENGSKQNLLSGGKAPAIDVMSSGDFSVTSATLQRVTGHYDPSQNYDPYYQDRHNNAYDHYEGLSTFGQNASVMVQDDGTGSYSDDFDSDSHHSSYCHPPDMFQSEPVNHTNYHNPPQEGYLESPEVDFAVPEVVYAQIGRTKPPSEAASYSPRRMEPPNYDNGTNAAPGGAIGVENPSYSTSPGDGSTNKLDSQYF